MKLYLRQTRAIKNHLGRAENSHAQWSLANKVPNVITL